MAHDVASVAQDHLIKDNGDINLSSFNYETCLNFLEHKVKTTTVKAGTLSRYRSSFRDHYKDQKIALPEEFGEDMKEIFQGC